MLDDNNVLKQRDPHGALAVAAQQYKQTQFEAEVRCRDHDGRAIQRVVVAGMGGSALAASILSVWLRSVLRVPMDIVRDYDLPGYVDETTLVIASSYSGSTEETISAFEQATHRGAQLSIIASGGTLLQTAANHDIAHVEIPSGMQPRMAVIYNLKALVAILANFAVVDGSYEAEIAETADWLHRETSAWETAVTTGKNYAKQLALQSVGKTPVFYGGALTAPIAYKWKISWNENAKNVAFWNAYPECNHNEFIGWTSHPIEKPFAIFDLVSPNEHPQILKRFAVSDRLLSGKRPKAIRVTLAGDTVLKQLLWGSILADFISCYVAILNGVNPTPVALIERLKRELANEQ